MSGRQIAALMETLERLMEMGAYGAVPAARAFDHFRSTLLETNDGLDALKLRAIRINRPSRKDSVPEVAPEAQRNEL